MTVKMGDDSQESKVVIVEATQAESASKKSVTKKRLIIAGASIIIAVVVIAGILLGVKFFLDAQKDIVTRTLEFADKDQKDKTLKEDITTDMNENLLQYHLADDSKELWTIEDYNRDIKVLKVRSPSGDMCFVTPLNGTDGTVEAARTSNLTTEPLDSVRTYYNIAQQPIKEKSILGPTGEALCTNIDVYWMTPSCISDTVTNHNRMKRCTVYHYHYPCYCCGYWHWCCVVVIVPCGGGGGTGGSGAGGSVGTGGSAGGGGGGGSGA